MAEKKEPRDEKLIEELYERLWWYTYEASEEEFDEKEVDAITRLLDVLEPVHDDTAYEPGADAALKRFWERYGEEEENAAMEDSVPEDGASVTAGPASLPDAEIPKPDGGVRKLGIPTVIDRIIQQAMLQQLMPVYEPLFSDDSFGYRPGRGAKDAISRIKEYIEQGYTRAVVLDLSKYFDTLNHTILVNLLRKQVKDERVVQMVKRYLKSGVMENGVVTETKEGSPQGGNLSPLLANVYLNEFDWEFHRRGVPCIRYADDIVLLAKSERAAERLLESSTKYLEGTLKLKVNREKSRTVSVFAIRNFKFLGFCFGKNGKGIYIRIHGKSWKKVKDKLRQLTSRSRCGSIVRTMKKIKVYMRGWLNYYGTADMKNNIESLNGWLYRRIRMCIWKQWKLPRTRKRKLIGLGLPEWAACEGAYSRKSYWRMSNTGVVKRVLTKERLINWGFYDLATAYQSLHVNY